MSRIMDNILEREESGEIVLPDYEKWLAETGQQDYSDQDIEMEDSDGLEETE